MNHTISEHLDDGLLRLGMHPRLTKPSVCVPAFLKTLKRNLTDASLAHPMMPTYLRLSGELPLNRPVIVLDAGGTTLRSALVRFTAEGPRIEDFRSCAMPGRDRELSLEEYLSAMVQVLSPFLDLSDRVGYCFSYPVTMQPEGDGVLAGFNKGIRVRGSSGMQVLASLKGALAAAGRPVPHFTLLNDAVAAACGGLALHGGSMPAGGLFSMILGTGTNHSFAVPAADLKLFPAAAAFPEKTMFVNPETAYYDVFPAGEADAAFFCAHPEMDLTPFMQKTGGAFLGPTIGLTARLLAEMPETRELFSKGCRQALSQSPQLSSEDCSLLLSGQAPEALTVLFPAEEDREALALIARRLIERAARCTACSLAAIMEFCGFGKTPEAPAELIADGSTFWKTPGLKEETEELLAELAREKGRGFCCIRQVEHVNLIGSAAAALLMPLPSSSVGLRPTAPP